MPAIAVLATVLMLLYSCSDDMVTGSNAKGDDAVERGTAVVHNYSSDGIDATFTKSGIYEMYLKFYDKDDFLLGNFWFEAIVVD